MPEPNMTPEIERLKADVSSGTALTIEQRAYLLSLIERDRWIPLLGEESPEQGQTVLVWFKDSEFEQRVVVMRRYQDWLQNCDDRIDIRSGVATHWRPLPPAPEEKL